MGAKPRTIKWTEDRVRKRFAYWQKRLRLEYVRFDIVFGEDTEDQSTGACHAQPEYEQGIVRFDLPNIKPTEVDAHIVHEILHYAIWPLSSFTHMLCDGDEKLLEILREKEEGLTTFVERLVENLTRFE